MRDLLVISKLTLRFLSVEILTWLVLLLINLSSDEWDNVSSDPYAYRSPTFKNSCFFYWFLLSKKLYWTGYCSLVSQSIRLLFSKRGIYSHSPNSQEPCIRFYHSFSHSLRGGFEPWFRRIDAVNLGRSWNWLIISWECAAFAYYSVNSKTDHLLRCTM